jgi:hypothetical protein
MVKRIALPLILLSTLFLGEIYNLWATPTLNLKSWFLLSDLKQDLEWYIKDTAEGVTWLIFLGVWYVREKQRNKFWAEIILLFIIFRLVDIGCYWMNHRHAGSVYLFTYLSIFSYGFCLTIRYNNRRK